MALSSYPRSNEVPHYSTSMINGEPRDRDRRHLFEIGHPLVSDLKESHRDGKRFHDAVIQRLQGEYSPIQNRIEQVHVDKLDGRVTNEFCDEECSEHVCDCRSDRMLTGVGKSRVRLSSENAQDSTQQIAVEKYGRYHEVCTSFISAEWCAWHSIATHQPSACNCRARSLRRRPFRLSDLRNRNAASNRSGFLHPFRFQRGG